MQCALGLAACGEDAAEAPAEGDERGARGEVLGGTISDDMIPLEELTSTSPPAEPVSDGPAVVSASDSDEDTGQAEPETPEAEAPESAPAPEAESGEE